MTELHKFDDLMETQENLVQQSHNGNQKEIQEYCLQPEEELEMLQLDKNFDRMKDHVLNLDHEIDTLFSAHDWLTVYHRSIKECKLDMGELMEDTRNPELLQADSKISAKNT